MFCLALNLARFRMSFLNRITVCSLITVSIMITFLGEGLDRAAYETVGKGLEGLVTIGAHTGVGAFEDGAGA